MPPPERVPGKLFTLGNDVAAKYETDYAAERARYLEVFGMIIAYRSSDGSDLGMVNLSGLEHQAEQVVARPPKRRRKTPAAPQGSTEHVDDATKTHETQ